MVETSFVLKTKVPYLGVTWGEAWYDFYNV